jgi:regulator of cell morphogenesis and NO signaling
MIANSAKTVRELAVELPNAARVFEKLGVDYCCGGEIPFTDACRKAGLNPDEVLASISQEPADPDPAQDWTKAPLAALARHIVEKHHSFTRSELARLEPLFSKVGAAHGERHPELARMQTVFRALATELQSHMMKEENILFPYLGAMERAVLSGQPFPRPMFGTVKNPVRMMMLEHDSAGEALRELRQASGDYAVPADVCVSYGELYRALQAFETDLHKHIHLENNILFPRALAMEAGTA